MGHAALAITDHDGLCGSLAFAQAARAAGVRPITGAELTLRDGSHLTLLVADATGYANLCRLITIAHAAHAPAAGSPAAAARPSIREAPGTHAHGLVCLTGCARHGLVPRLVAAGERAARRGRRARRWYRLRARATSRWRSSARARGATGAWPASWPSWPRRPGCPASRPAIPTPTHPGGRCCRTPSWRSATASPWTAPRTPAAATATPCCGRRPRRPRAVRRPPRCRGADRAHGRAPGVRPHPRPGIPLPRLRRIAPGRDGPDRAGPRLRAPARRALPQRRPSAWRPGRGWTRSWR